MPCVLQCKLVIRFYGSEGGLHEKAAVPSQVLARWVFLRFLDIDSLIPLFESRYLASAALKLKLTGFIRITELMIYTFRFTLKH